MVKLVYNLYMYHIYTSVILIMCKNLNEFEQFLEE